MRRYLRCVVKSELIAAEGWGHSVSHSVNETNCWKINPLRLSDHREVTCGLEILEMQKAGRRLVGRYSCVLPCSYALPEAFVRIGVVGWKYLLFGSGFFFFFVYFSNRLDCMVVK